MQNSRAGEREADGDARVEAEIACGVVQRGFDGVGGGGEIGLCEFELCGFGPWCGLIGEVDFVGDGFTGGGCGDNLEMIFAGDERRFPAQAGAQGSPASCVFLRREICR